MKVFIRRLFTDPITGNLTAMDTHRRLFPPAAQGGPTRINNGQGLCQSCNLTKEAAGWTSTPNPDGSIIITTPTGHHYPNSPPPPPRSLPWTDYVFQPPSWLEHALTELLASAM